jgi:phage terminase large subunit GpA-like protein
MQRYYVGCPTYGRRMRLIGQSSETFGPPPGPTERYYRCPHCDAEWTHDREQNMIGRGVPDNSTQGGTTPR